MEASQCQCGGLPALAIVGMGEHEETFRTLVETHKRGMPWWWLFASSCQVCGQAWLVAAEERQNDLYIMRRLDAEESRQLDQSGVWPPDFDRYETLLEIGRATGRRVQFLEPENSSLVYTIMDLAKERPGIQLSTLASLLNLDAVLARRLVDLALSKEKLVITLDDAGDGAPTTH